MRRSLSRRRLLQLSGAGLAGLATGCVPEKPLPESETGDTATAADPWGEAPTECATATMRRGEGPFYLEGSPERTALNIYGREGTLIRLYVRVVDQDCAPIAGAVIEVYHCGPDEEYVMDDEAMPYRGTIITDEDGKAWFESLEPPPYLDENGLMRPHIHYKINAEGYEELTAQTKFAHDPELDEPIESLVVVEFTDVGGVLEGQHTFILVPTGESYP